LNKSFCFNRLRVECVLQFWCNQQTWFIERIWGKISSRVDFPAGKIDTEFL
jgi:hypothetical protein